MWVLLQVLPEGFKELAPDPQEAEAAALKEEEEAAAFVSALPCLALDVTASTIGCLIVKLV